MERLDKFFAKLAGPSLKRYGFTSGDILSRWPDIVGPELARFCRPERIRWPRSPEAPQKQGGTLFLTVQVGHSLDIQHQAPRIVERINQFYGYGAITVVKIITQSLPVFPLARRPLPPPLSSGEKARITEKLQSFQSPELQAALLRLGSAVVLTRSSPQTK